MTLKKKKIKWGIIGVGNVCEKKSGPAFNKVPNSKLVAVMRRTLEKAKEYAEIHKVPRYYNNAEVLINDEDVNAIYIATPPAHHEEYALKAMAAGKPVYIEKPVTLTAASCLNIMAASDMHQVKASVAHYRRRLPLFLKIKELITKGVIGDVRLITIRLFQAPESVLSLQTSENWRIRPEVSGGGIFHDLAPHQLDIIYWILGQPTQYNGNSFNQGKRYHAPDITQLEVQFNAEILLDGLWSFNIHKSNEEDRCEIFGSEGKLSFSFFRNPKLEIQTEKGIEVLEFPYPEHVQQPMIADVVKYFRGKGENPCSLQDALWSMRMMDCTMLV